tara:strand:+ start:414 stop:749 length:336 start_codon:yes stop_codon:yes gene_type:complete
MKYNFIKELYNGDFSWRKDLEQTVDDFRKLGIEKIFIDIPGMVFGRITAAEDRFIIPTAEMLAVAMEIGAGANYLAGNVDAAIYSALMGLCLLGITATHHVHQGVYQTMRG